MLLILYLCLAELSPKFRKQSEMKRQTFVCDKYT